MVEKPVFYSAVQRSGLSSSAALSSSVLSSTNESQLKIHGNSSDAELCERFRALIDQVDGRIALDEAALTIAGVAYPSLLVQKYIDRLDQLADDIAKRLPTEAQELEFVSTMQRVLFHEHGLRGNRENYYDPRNSYLNDVLDRQLGIPISLAVVYLAVADRLSLPVNGISFPGHFLLRWRLSAGQIIIDPFNQGATLGDEEITKLAEGVLGTRLPDEVVATRFLVPCDRRQVLARLLRNLEAIKGQDSGNERSMQQRLTFLNLCLVAAPNAVSQLLNRAELLVQMECHAAAVEDIARVRELIHDSGEDARGFEQRILALQDTLPKLH